MFVTDTSGLTSGGVAVVLEGSDDNANWVTVGTTVNLSTGQTGTAATSSSTAVPLPRYLRANAISLSGGRVVDAWIGVVVADG